MSGKRAPLDELASLGIDLSNVGAVLEHEGIVSFVKSWDDLIKFVDEQISKAGAEVMPAGMTKPAGSTAGPAAGAPERTARTG